MVLLCQHHVTVAQRPTGHKDGPEGIEKGGGAAQRDQRVHVRAAVPQGSETVNKVVVIDIHDGDHQHQLSQREHHAVFYAGQDRGQGKSDHVAHAEIKERHKEADRGDEPMSHLFLLLSRRTFGRRSGSLFFAMYSGMIARLVHCRADVGGREL